MSQNVVSPRSRSTAYTCPYSWCGATTRVPAGASRSSAALIAAMPEAKQWPASAPSSSATAAASSSLLGLRMRL